MLRLEQSFLLHVGTNLSFARHMSGRPCSSTDSLFVRPWRRTSVHGDDRCTQRAFMALICNERVVGILNANKLYSFILLACGGKPSSFAWKGGQSSSFLQKWENRRDPSRCLVTGHATQDLRGIVLDHNTGRAVPSRRSSGHSSALTNCKNK